MRDDAGDSPREAGKERLTKRKRKGNTVGDESVNCKRTILSDSECE